MLLLFAMIRKSNALKYVTVVLTLVFLTIVTNIVSASPGTYYVWGDNDDDEYGVQARIYYDDQSPYPSSAVVGFVCLFKDNSNWMCIGVYEGQPPVGDEVYTPHYYYDKCYLGTYYFSDLGSAYDSYDEFKVDFISSGSGTMKAYIDGSEKVSQTDVGYSASIVQGVAESKESRNDMEYHFKYVKYKNSNGNWNYFDDTNMYANYPYYYSATSDSEWYVDSYN